jgi:NAD(P)-dependent dehydrogenase (short-subunit alcohol dehydrogenase family)
MWFLVAGAWEEKPSPIRGIAPKIIVMPTGLFSLQDKHALVTGGGTGIGLAISEAFCGAGAHIIMAGRREGVLQRACEQLGPNASYRVCDLSRSETVSDLIALIENSGVALDILVNNAGINARKPTLEVTNEDFEEIIQTNLMGLFALSREVARRMAARGQGSILNITSMAALYGLPRVAAYSAAKSAVLGLTRTLAVEWAPSGIRVNALAPGFVQSDMTDQAFQSDPERKRRALERTPMGRLGHAKEVAAAALFLCSDAASFITGVHLPVDGGNSIGF